MRIIINSSSMVPIYEQITDQIKALIQCGELKANDSLPSVRTLSKELKISALTVKKAYDSLEEDGFTVTIHGKGTYVASVSPQLLLEEQKKELERFGIASAAVENAGKASMLLSRLYKRQREGYARPKQINKLEEKGFQNVGTWTFEQADKMLSRLAALGWKRIPPGIDPKTYIPEEA